MDGNQLAILRKPFLPNQISQMCRSTKKDNTKGKCPKCGGWHGLPAVQLDYVGHAALTDRLLDADPAWSWEPLSLGENGLPRLDENGGMWIKLTVGGVTRLGYGDAQNRTGGDGIKEMIGDALRNAAMRFGAALDLWHKGDLHLPEEENEKDKKPKITKAESEAKEAFDALSPALQEDLRNRAMNTIYELEREDYSSAYDEYKSLEWENEIMHTAFWALFNAQQRGAMKKISTDRAKAAAIAKFNAEQAQAENAK